jgi:hypothetical protein
MLDNIIIKYISGRNYVEFNISERRYQNKVTQISGHFGNNKNTAKNTKNTQLKFYKEIAVPA